MRKKDLELYLNNPITKDLLELLKEHRDASFTMISDVMIGVPSLADLDLCKIAEYRGQVNTFDRVLDLEDFLSERLEETKEVKHEEDDSIRSEFNN